MDLPTEMTTLTLPANAENIARAVELLEAGGIAAIPTETVYGLAARADDPAAVARVYAAKGRPDFNPLIVHVAGLAQAADLVRVDAKSRAMMERFWPGPLTLVLPVRPGARIAGVIRAGLPTLAVRCPAHPVMQAIIAGVGPVAAPSANLSGQLSPTRAEHVRASLDGRIPLILDGGPCEAGVESTIVAVTAQGVVLLRPGVIPADRLGVRGGPSPVTTISAPGQLASHYAPRQPVRLEARTASRHEFHIGFGIIRGDLSLSSSGDVTEAATRLFDLLHEAQDSGQPAIAVAPIPQHGLGAAINDRLRRAAAGRTVLASNYDIAND